MSNINDIERISVDLVQLKPIKVQKMVYESYKTYLSKFFENGEEKEGCFDYVSCSVCGTDNKELLFELDNFKYKNCKNCGSIYNSPRLKEELLLKMYSEGEYENYVNQLTLPGDAIRKNVTEVRKYHQVNALFEKTGKILDVGCGAGTFLSIAKENGWDTTGIDLSRTGCEEACEKGVRIVETTFDDYQADEKFDCVTFWGVLEHVTKPIEQLEKAISLLNPGGVVVFEAPSSDSLLMQYVKKRNVAPYRYIESARHITFFSRKSIDLMCENNDLDLEYIESNGLDIQTVLLYEFDKEIIEKIKDIQQLIDENLLSDHYRVFLRKR